MDVSAVILTWNSDKYIEICLSSLIKSLEYDNFTYEILLVDNGSTDNTVSILKKIEQKYQDKIHCTLLDRNFGTTIPRNIALRQARGKYIIIMDSDVKVLNGTIRRLISTLIISYRSGIVVPKLLYPNGSLQKSTDVFPTLITKLFRLFFLKSIEKRQENKCKVKSLQEVDYAISAMWILRKEIFAKVGLLDESIFYSPEDVDFCLRVWKAGYKIIYDPTAAAIHHAQEISRSLKINQATINHVKGLFYYFKKHKCFLKRPRIISISLPLG